MYLQGEGGVLGFVRISCVSCEDVANPPSPREGINLPPEACECMAGDLRVIVTPQYELQYVQVKVSHDVSQLDCTKTQC